MLASTKIVNKISKSSSDIQHEPAVTIPLLPLALRTLSEALKNLIFTFLFHVQNQWVPHYYNAIIMLRIVCPL